MRARDNKEEREVESSIINSTVYNVYLFTFYLVHSSM